MTFDLSKQARPQPRYAAAVNLLFILYVRTLALVFFVGALYIWAKLVGVWPGAENRYDTMSPMLKIYCTVLAVVLPVASVGMWTTLAWGRAIWFMLIGFQVVSALRFLDVVDYAAVILVFHAVSLSVYMFFQILLFFINKKA